jgi:hypothetical protein
MRKQRSLLQTKQRLPGFHLIVAIQQPHSVEAVQPHQPKVHPAAKAAKAALQIGRINCRPSNMLCNQPAVKQLPKSCKHGVHKPLTGTAHAAAAQQLH